MKKPATMCILAVVVAAGAGGCEKTQQRGFYDPAGPEWSYDQPFYMLSADSPAPLARFDGPPVDVYTPKRQMIIPRPVTADAHASRKAPRTAIWLSADQGVTWEKIGYYGLQQDVYFYPVDSDGPYGVRFIGPGVPPARCKPPKPHMIYHVDTTPPEIAVFVTPNKEYYVPGDELTVEWHAHDINVKPESVRLGVCIDSEDAKFKWAFIGKTHPRVGREVLVLPDAAVHKTMKLRVTCEDLAGNLGFGYSCPIQVVLEAVPDPEMAEDASIPPAPESVATTQPAESGAKVIVEDTPQILTPMPAEYPELEDDEQE